MPKLNEMKPYKIKMVKRIAAYATAGAFALGSVALYAKKMRIFKTVGKEQEKEQ